MTTKAQQRTEEKLRFAQIHLEELGNYPKATSNDEWENAHQESCFFHLAGSVEAILHEVNEGYSLNIDLTNVKWSVVKNQLKNSNQSSAAYDHLKQLKSDKNSWLSQLFEWRNHGAHRKRIGKIVTLSVQRRVDNEFMDPRTGKPQKVYPNLGCLAVLKLLSKDVRSLIDKCREIDPKL